MMSPDEADKMRLMFSTAGWNDVMMPRIQNRIRTHIRTLLEYPEKRKEEDRDDRSLRTRIEELEWVLVAFQNEANIALHNQRIDELAAQAEMNGTEEVGSVTPANP